MKYRRSWAFWAKRKSLSTSFTFCNIWFSWRFMCGVRGLVRADSSWLISTPLREHWSVFHELWIHLRSRKFYLFLFMVSLLEVLIQFHAPCRDDKNKSYIFPAVIAGQESFAIDASDLVFFSMFGVM
jgi:hypothetical protein